MRKVNAIEKKEAKAPRNKTIDFTKDEGKRYYDRLMHLDKPTPLEALLNKTILGDTLRILEFLPNNSVDLVVVDPPYNLSKNYHGNLFDKKRTDEYADYTRQWLEKVMAKMKDTASMYVCCDWKSSLIIGPILNDYLNVQNRITWQREKGRGSKKNWKNAMEDIWFVTKGKDYTFNVEDVKMRKKVLAPYKVDGLPKDWDETNEGKFRNSYPSNFWDDISVPYWSMPENTAHPTQKPEKLMAKLLLASSNKDDVVLDPFLGSGTTSVVAKKLGRRYIGIETNERYCLWAEHRLEKATHDKTIQGFASGVFWERNTLTEKQKTTKKN